MSASTTRRTATSMGGTVALRAAGPLVVLIGWELLALTVFRGRHTVPTPTSVLDRAWHDRSFAWPHVRQTAKEAGLGWVYGNAFAIVAGFVFVVVRPIERIFFRLFVALYCLPLVAIAPVLSAVMSGDGPQQVVAAQSVFFTTLVAVMIGGHSADRSALDLVSASGGGAGSQLLRVRLHSALPSLFAGLRIAGPAAVLGAVIGEYLGGSKGIGVAMVYSEQSLDVTRTWGLALDTTLLAGAAFIAVALAEKILLPWVRETTPSLLPPTTGSGSAPMRALRTAGFAVLSLVVLAVAWAGVIKLAGWNSYFAKGPLDVWRYLFEGTDAGANRSDLLHSLQTSLRDAALGFVTGGVGAVLLAAAVVTSDAVSTLVMPVAVALRVVPLVAMTPLIALIFGRGLVTVAVISGLVTFFPVLVAIVAAMRSAPAVSSDLVSAYGGSRWTLLRHVQLPYALPALLGASRIAAPTALLGALLAEWLATGDGIGFVMYNAPTQGQYGRLWSAVALLTLASLSVYGIASLAESITLRRLAGSTR